MRCCNYLVLPKFKAKLIKLIISQKIYRAHVST